MADVTQPHEPRAKKLTKAKVSRGGWLKHGNPPGNPTKAPRWGQGPGAGQRASALRCVTGPGVGHEVSTPPRLLCMSATQARDAYNPLIWPSRRALVSAPTKS
jgi:hypothetical protein